MILAKMTKYLVTGVILLTSMNAVAATGTQISLGGGVVKAKYGELGLSVTQLKPGITYTIQCGISSTAATKMHFVMDGAVFTYENIPAQLNGLALPGSLANGANGSVNPGENTLKITSFTRSKQFSQGSPTFLRFINLDDTATQTVHDCFADVV